METETYPPQRIMAHLKNSYTPIKTSQNYLQKKEGFKKALLTKSDNDG